MGIVPGRLAAASWDDRLPDSVIDADHKRVVEEALAWQGAAGLATFWEMGATHRGADQDRMYALAGQMAAAGEQLGLGSAAGNEVAIWREFREGKEPETSYELCMRGMAETQCLFVMSTAHGFVNVGLKALALDSDLRSRLGERFAGSAGEPTFDPFSAERRDWISMNGTNCKALNKTAQSSNKIEIAELIAPVVEFGLGPTWRELDERRGEDFHRWRMQTDGVEGVPRRTPWSSDGKTRMLEIGRPTYEEARGLADHVARIADAAILDLARSMERFRQQLPKASVHLGGPEFNLKNGTRLLEG